MTDRRIESVEQQIVGNLCMHPPGQSGAITISKIRFSKSMLGGGLYERLLTIGLRGIQGTPGVS